MIPGESVHSPLPFDLPWWQPDHAIFFGVLYLVIMFLGLGLVFAVLKTFKDCSSHAAHGSHH